MAEDAGSSTAPMERVRRPKTASPARRSRSTSHWISWWTGHVEAQLSNGFGPNPACPRAMPWRGRLSRESSRNAPGCGHGHLWNKNPRGTFPTSRRTCAATTRKAVVNPPSRSRFRPRGPLHRSKPHLFSHCLYEYRKLRCVCVCVLVTFCSRNVRVYVNMCRYMPSLSLKHNVFYIYIYLCYSYIYIYIYACVFYYIYIYIYICACIAQANLISWLQHTSAKIVPNAKPSELANCWYH